MVPSYVAAFFRHKHFAHSLITSFAYIVSKEYLFTDVSDDKAEVVCCFLNVVIIY